MERLVGPWRVLKGLGHFSPSRGPCRLGWKSGWAPKNKKRHTIPPGLTHTAPPLPPAYEPENRVSIMLLKITYTLIAFTQCQALF